MLHSLKWRRGLGLIVVGGICDSGLELDWE